MNDLSCPNPVLVTNVPLVPDGDANLGVGDPAVVPSITLEQLEFYVHAKVRDQAKEEGLKEKQVKGRVDQAVTALNRAGLKRDATQPARPALEASFQHLNQRAEKKENDRKPANQAKLVLGLLKELEAVREREAETSPRPPKAFIVALPTFGSDLKRHRALSGYSQNALATKFGIHSSIISRWENDMLPEDNEQRRAIIIAIGNEIGCGGEHLWKLAGDQLRVADKWPEEVPEKMRVRVTKQVGNLRGLSSKERCEARSKAYAEIVKRDNANPKQEPYSLGFDIDAWPRLFAEDWKWHLRLVLAGEKLPPEGKAIIELTEDEKRTRPVDPNTGLRIYTSGIPLEDPTARKRTKDLSIIFGSCINLERPAEIAREPQGDGSVKETAHQVQPPPLTLDHLAKVGFALVAFPALIEHHFAALKHRRGQQKTRDGKQKDAKLTRDRSRYAGFFRGILHCLGQQPRYADRLVPVPGLITAEDVQAAKSDWKKFCEKASDRYKTIYDGEKHRISKPYDHAIGIAGILEGEESQEALHAIFEFHAGRLRAMPSRNRQRAHQLRKAFACGLKAQAYLRPGTEQLLDTDNLVCRVERRKTVWRLQAPAEFFKNHRSPAIKDGENRALTDLKGVFYDVIEEYLEWARDFILAGAKTDALIVRTPSNPRFVGDKSYSDWWVRVSAEAMAEGRPEYHGAVRMNSIQVRKIGATDAFKKTGEIAEAAKVLGNTERCAQIYVKETAAARTENSTARVAAVDAARQEKAKQPEPSEAA
jgi:transcriptional regulator with XRE-family HTH domain